MTSKMYCLFIVLYIRQYLTYCFDVNWHQKFSTGYVYLKITFNYRVIKFSHGLTDSESTETVQHHNSLFSMLNCTFFLYYNIQNINSLLLSWVDRVYVQKSIALYVVYSYRAHIFKPFLVPKNRFPAGGPVRQPYLLYRPSRAGIF